MNSIVNAISRFFVLLSNKFDNEVNSGVMGILGNGRIREKNKKFEIQNKNLNFYRLFDAK